MWLASGIFLFSVWMISVCVKVSLLLCIFTSPESVIKHFEGREGAVDSRGVVEYLRALVATNAIAEYLPNEEYGKPSRLPTLVFTLSNSFYLMLFSLC